MCKAFRKAYGPSPLPMGGTRLHGFIAKSARAQDNTCYHVPMIHTQTPTTIYTHTLLDTTEGGRINLMAICVGEGGGDFYKAFQNRISKHKFEI